MGWPSRSRTRPPAARNTASPAAVSHSMVGAGRGYTSACPLATRTNFNDEPIDTLSFTPASASQASVSGVLWDFDATAQGGCLGLRTLIDSALPRGACGG